MQAGSLYMLPVGISDVAPSASLPEENICIMGKLRHFIVENVRTARRYLKRCNPDMPIGDCTFFELNEHTDPAQASTFLQPLREGHDLGMMSEAGCPGVADPGALMAQMAQREGYRVIPLPGPSSILMSLMASGFNGQGFAFHGYLPIDASRRVAKIKALEAAARKDSMTQIFIETPYRTNQLLEVLTATLQPSTMLCVAYAISDMEKESIISMPVKKWREKLPHYDKAPAIFLIHSAQS